MDGGLWGCDVDGQIQLFEGHCHNASIIFYHWVRRSISKNIFAVSFPVRAAFYLSGESKQGGSRKGGGLDGYRIADANSLSFLHHVSCIGAHLLLLVRILVCHEKVLC